MGWDGWGGMGRMNEWMDGLRLAVGPWDGMLGEDVTPAGWLMEMRAWKDYGPQFPHGRI